jgi:spermidine synthase
LRHFSPRLATFILGLSMFFTGASGLVGEYILSTVSTYILGNSIEQFSITIALMLGMMGLGGWVQKFIKSEHLLEKLILIEIALALLIGFSPIAIYGAYGYFPNHFYLILYFFVLMIGFLIGFEIPLIIRLNESFSKTLQANLSTVISADYFGSLVGAMLWVYYLLPNFSITQSGFMISGLNFAIAILMALYFWLYKKIHYVKTMLALLLITLVALILGYTNQSKWNLFLEQKMYEDKIVFAKTTRYQHLVMTHNPSLDEYRFYINGNVQFSSLDEERYHEFLVHPAMAVHGDAKRILILGGGDGLALKQLHRYPNIKEIVLVELDPKMVELFSTNPILTRFNDHAFQNTNLISSTLALKENRESKTVVTQQINSFGIKERVQHEVEVFHIDADRFLDTLYQKKFDVVFIDFPDPSSIELVKLYSKEFYLKLKRVLSLNAVIALQATSPYHAKEAYLCINRTLKSAGFSSVPYHYNIPSFGDWGWFLFSQNSHLQTKVDDLEAFKSETTFITPELFKSALVFGKGELVSDRREINTLMKPVLLDIYTKNAWLVY